VWIKICGLTSPEDAALALSLGADALGINFVPASRRYVDPSQVSRVLEPVRGKLEIVGVVADLGQAELLALQLRFDLDWLQLHGKESPELVRALPRAFKAIGIDDAKDVEDASSFPGRRLLVDKKAPAELGGTGRAFDWSLVTELSRERELVLAGGLNPENVAQAIRVVSPFGVDVASGVELPGTPRKKDPERLAAFIARARASTSSGS
jgi:phosphoribosylanthranilate isomerase